MKSKEYVCQSCGYPTPSWFGKCPQCGGWDTFLERIPTSRPEKKPPSPSGKRPVSLEAISEKEMTSDTRFPSGISEVDRVLGGGIVEGSLSLLSGDPGIGKSTLLLAIAGGVARAGKKAVYISTEESLHQLFIRIQRLHFPRFPNLFVFSTDQFGDVESAVDTVHPDLMIVDSIQNLSIEEVESLPGSITLIRDLTLRCLEISKKRNVALFLVGHVTKEGTVAGPRTLEHLVDVVLYLDGEPQGPLRILRSVKNRF
ncbi:MAG: ATPase domain-containing protein, partial [Atribacterota bacterium]